MKLVDSISLEELIAMSENMYDALVKGVVDVDRELLVLDAPMQADEELFLLEQGSQQESLWGINLYPEDFGSEDFIEYDSMINIRPAQNNRSRNVEDESIRERIAEIIMEKVHEQLRSR